jgi:hypothetical protein
MVCVSFLFGLFFVSAAAAAESDNGATASDVVILTEQNFESETQASTGATTGDWLIEFYAPW